MVYCQPLINVRARSGGIELLLRWHNARQGWIAPDVFIPLAERQSLIKPLTRFLLTEVVKQLPYLPNSPTFHIAINVAASHFRDRAILQDLWWPANPVPKLVVELTKCNALPVVDQTVIAQLHEIGVRLAILAPATAHSLLSERFTA